MNFALATGKRSFASFGVKLLASSLYCCWPRIVRASGPCL